MPPAPKLKARDKFSPRIQPARCADIPRVDNIAKKSNGNIPKSSLSQSGDKLTASAVQGGENDPASAVQGGENDPASAVQGGDKKGIGKNRRGLGQQHTTPHVHGSKKQASIKNNIAFFYPL
jgi:hypothetical protein